MSASFLVIGSSFPSTSSQQNNGSHGNTWTDCGSCLNVNYDAQTCCVIILPTGVAALFFVWFFFQKGHLAVGLVLAQLLAIILLGVLSFLVATALRRCWRRIKAILRPNKNSMVAEIGEPQPQQVQV